MIFTTILSFILIFCGIQINLNLNDTYSEVKEIFGTSIGRNTDILVNAEIEKQTTYCKNNIPLYLAVQSSM
jgi:hypothetical protein